MVSTSRSKKASISLDDENLPKGKSRKKEKIQLSDEQKKVLDMVVRDGKNVFFTGSAGKCLSCLCMTYLAGGDY